jgi:hypothetical protein
VYREATPGAVLFLQVQFLTAFEPAIFLAGITDRLMQLLEVAWSSS